MFLSRSECSDKVNGKKITSQGRLIRRKIVTSNVMRREEKKSKINEIEKFERSE